MEYAKRSIAQIMTEDPEPIRPTDWTIKVNNMENSDKYIVGADPIVDEWSKIEYIDEKDIEDTSEYIKEDMKQYPDDKQLDDFLESIPSTIEGKDLMPSYMDFTRYSIHKILEDKDIISLKYKDLDQVYNELELMYTEEYTPKYRRELRTWYARNKKQHLFNLHEELNETQQNNRTDLSN